MFSEKTSGEYLDSLKGEIKDLPSILIEAYMADDPSLVKWIGSNNSKKIDCPGVSLEISFNEDYRGVYEEMIKNEKENIRCIPTEYYKVEWKYFNGDVVSPRGISIDVSYINPESIRLQSGTDYYLQKIIDGGLNNAERAALSVAYRKLKEDFSQNESIKTINSELSKNKGAISNKNLTMSLDVSQKTSWETTLTPHLDNLPLQYSGTGEQNTVKIMLAIDKKCTNSQIVLIEEPESHLSYSSMNKLLKMITNKCAGKQLIITTHSSFVLNKLGMEKLILLANGKKFYLSNLSEDTYTYFRRLSGYDTLRLILSKKAILVEGPSDELIVQKAYNDKYPGNLPIDQGIDVINVRGLSFARFLDISKELEIDTVVVTDNDGDHNKKVVEKYKPYSTCKSIKICASSDDKYRTLEPQFVNCNGLNVMNKILNKSFSDEKTLIDYMEEHKTEWSLAVFDSNEKINYPQYINDSIN